MHVSSGSDCTGGWSAGSHVSCYLSIHSVRVFNVELGLAIILRGRGVRRRSPLRTKNFYLLGTNSRRCSVSGLRFWSSLFRLEYLTARPTFFGRLARPQAGNQTNSTDRQCAGQSSPTCQPALIVGGQANSDSFEYDQQGTPGCAIATSTTLTTLLTSIGPSTTLVQTVVTTSVTTTISLDSSPPTAVMEAATASASSNNNQLAGSTSSAKMTQSATVTPETSTLTTTSDTPMMAPTSQVSVGSDIVALPVSSTITASCTCD